MDRKRGAFLSDADKRPVCCQYQSSVCPFVIEGVVFKGDPDVSFKTITPVFHQDI